MKFRTITLLLLSLVLSSCNFGHYPDNYPSTLQLSSIHWTADNASMFVLARIPKDDGRTSTQKIFHYDAAGVKVKEYTLFDENGYVQSFYITPDGKRCLYEGSTDYGIHLIEIETGKELFNKSHTSLISTSPDGNNFVSSSSYYSGPYRTYHFYSLVGGAVMLTDSLTILSRNGNNFPLLLAGRKSASLEYDSLNVVRMVFRDSSLRVTKIIQGSFFNMYNYPYAAVSDVFALLASETVYVINTVNATADSLLSRNDNNFYGMTHDGKRILFMKRGELRITIRDIQTHADQYIDINDSPYNCYLSPDDKKLAYVKRIGGKDDEIVVVNIP